MSRLSVIDPDLPDDYVTHADVLRAEGRAAAARDLLLRLATARFGPPGRAQQERLHALSADDLTDRAVAVLTAAGWDDLLG